MTRMQDQGARIPLSTWEKEGKGKLGYSYCRGQRPQWGRRPTPAHPAVRQPGLPNEPHLLHFEMVKTKTISVFEIHIPVSTNKALLEHSHNHWFLYCLWLLLHGSGRAEGLWERIYEPQGLKDILPLQKKFSEPWPIVSCHHYIPELTEVADRVA